MKHRSFRLLTFVVAALFLTGAESAAQTKTTKPLVLAVVFAGPAEPLEQHFRPLADYAARKLSGSEQTKGAIIVAPSAGQMIKLLEEKRIDFYMESPYPTYMINRLGSARLLLRSWKGGMPDYRSVIFTRKDGGVAQLKDLRGNIIAFEDPGSTSGYFLPKVFLLKQGFSVEEKPAANSKVAAGEIGYIFAHNADAIANLVLEGKTAAGAFSTDDYARLDEKNQKLISIVSETESVPRHLVSVRKDLPESVVRRLKDILLGMHQDKEGQQILRKMDNTTKFDLLPGGEESVRRKLVELYRPRGRK